MCAFCPPNITHTQLEEGGETFFIETRVGRRGREIGGMGKKRRRRRVTFS